jgi:hypothetical protein
MRTSKNFATEIEPNRAAIPPAVVSAIEQLREAIDQAGLPRSIRLKVAAAVRHAIVPAIAPKRKPDKKRHRIDSAYADYRVGLRGLDLFRKHIPRHDKLSKWRRTYEQRKLLKTLGKRAERDRKRQKTPTTRAKELSDRHPDSGICRPDKSA